MDRGNAGRLIARYIEEGPVRETQRGDTMRAIRAQLRAVGDRYPHVPSLSLAFLLAWQRAIAPLVWHGSAPWIGETLTDHGYSMYSHAVLGLCLVIGLVLGIVARGRRYVRLWGAGAIAACGSGIMVASLVAGAPSPVFGAGCVVAGCGMGMLFVRCMALFCQASPTGVLMLAAHAWALGFTVDVLLKNTPVLVGAAGLCALPLVAMGLLGLGGDAVRPREHRTTVAGRTWLGLPGAFWRFVGTIALVALVAQTVVFLNSQNEAERRALVSYSSVAVVFIAALLMVYAAVSPRSYRYSRLYHPVVFAVVVLLGLLLVTPEGKD